MTHRVSIRHCEGHPVATHRDASHRDVVRLDECRHRAVRCCAERCRNEGLQCGVRGHRDHESPVRGIRLRALADLREVRAIRTNLRDRNA